MKKFIYFVLFGVIMPMAFTGCDGEDNPVSNSFYLSAEQKVTIQQSNQFAFNLYKKLNNQADVANESNVLSPLSVTYMLGMLNAGIEGEGSEEILKALGMEGCSTEFLNDLCQTLLYDSPLVDTKVKLSQANCVLANKDIALKEDYVNDMNFYYRAEVSSVDFSDPATLPYINNWCNEHTNGLIPEILKEIDPSTIMMLMNAIYFDAPWKSKFDENNTKNLRFTREDGSSTVLPLMCQTSSFAYGANNTYATVRLPYGENDMWNMYVLLPNEGKTVKNVLSSLTSKTWKENVAKMSSNYIVNLRLPRFETSSSFKLTDVMKALGITSMFSPETAYFTKMTDAPIAYVDEIHQKAVIKVQEKGTEAAAVTYTEIDGADIEGEEKTVVNFYANHPFVYIIQEASSDAIFFLGTYQGN